MSKRNWAGLAFALTMTVSFMLPMGVGLYWRALRAEKQIYACPACSPGAWENSYARKMYLLGRKEGVESYREWKSKQPEEILLPGGFENWHWSEQSRWRRLTSDERLLRMEEQWPEEIPAESEARDD